MRCKYCGNDIPLKDEDFNEPEEGTEYFAKVTNPEDEEFTTKIEDFFCSLPCLIEYEASS